MSGDRTGDTFVAGALVGVGGLSTAFWVAGHTAAALAGGDLEARWARGAVAMVRTPMRPEDPEWAWQAPPGTFGPLWLYWVTVGVVLAVAAVAMVRVWMWWTKFNVSLDRRERLGVVPGARMGTKADLGPIRVGGPVGGRFTFGRVMGELVATEWAATLTRRQIRNRAKNRRGDRTSLMVFGPTRSGKTATIVPGILEWDYPAVISSVKPDLMYQTVKRRLEIGTVYLFDPFDEAENVPDGVERVSWSPISCATTTDGAIDAAQTLADAAASDDVTAGGFWSDRGKTVLRPLLFAAHAANKSMSDVLGWLANHDPAEDASQVLSLLRQLEAEGGPVAFQARVARESAEGWARLDPKQRSDQMATAQSLVSCWNNLHAAAASSRALQPIDIGMILSGRNTLYIVAPLGRGDQYAPLFGGLFGDLIRDQTYRVHNAAGTEIGPLLAVLDEAANTPLRWLPEVASTCAGIGVQLVTIWQDLSQIEALYSEYAESLLNNHATKVFFAGQTDQKTLEYASQICGEEDITSLAASADVNSGSTRRSASAQIVSKRLVPPDMIRVIPNGTALLVHNTLHPFHLVGRRVNEEPGLARYATSRTDPSPTRPTPTQDPGTLIDAPSTAPARFRSRPDEPARLVGDYTLSDRVRDALAAAHVSINHHTIALLEHDIAASRVQGPRRCEPRRQPLGY